MHREKRKKLEARGWKFTTVKDFLGLTQEEERIIELKIVLSDALKQERSKAALTQEKLAEKMSSSQSRIAKMEAADPSVSLDLLISGLFSLGVDKRRLSEIIAGDI